LRKLLYCSLLLLPIIAYTDEGRVDVARFSQSELYGWQTKIFSGQTHYSFVNSNGYTVLQANSTKSASGLFRNVSINLSKTPILHWSWKVDNVLKNVDELSKAGDDYPARVYVVFSGGAAFWHTRAINYVWSNNRPIKSNWPNAYTKNAHMIAVQSGGEQLGKWVEEQRDVIADYRRIYGEEPGNVDAVAIMTDSDDSKSKTAAWYGDIWFSEK